MAGHCGDKERTGSVPGADARATLAGAFSVVRAVLFLVGLHHRANGRRRGLASRHSQGRPDRLLPRPLPGRASRAHGRPHGRWGKAPYRITQGPGMDEPGSLLNCTSPTLLPFSSGACPALGPLQITPLITLWSTRAAHMCRYG